MEQSVNLELADEFIPAETDNRNPEIEKLQAENQALKAKLAFHGIPADTANDGIYLPAELFDSLPDDDDEDIEEPVAGIFGIKNSNRNHSSADSWGKNQFNNSFPVGLVSYMNSKKIEPVYLKVDKNFDVKHGTIGFKDLTGCAFEPENIYYAFESAFAPFDGISSSASIPSIDVVVKNNNASGVHTPASSFEIKLTTLPDNTTAHLSEDKYGSELVVRPDTIVYQALSICNSLKTERAEMAKILNPVHQKITNWHDVDEVAKNMGSIIATMEAFVAKFSEKQKPLLIQPVWKTEGKAAIMAENCLDAFVWSDFSLMKLFVKNQGTARVEVGRNDRTIVWLFLMLHEFASNGKIDHRNIIDSYTYGTKNDKAFAASGKVTNAIMACKELTTPRITKGEIRNIILGNGQKHLSPERRFDAVIQSDVSIFQTPSEKVAEAVTEVIEQA